MARYFFHLWNGQRYEIDQEGVDFNDCNAAFIDAFAAAREISSDMELKGENPLPMHFEIVDQKGRHLFTLSFLDAWHGASLAAARPRGVRSSALLRTELSRAVAAAGDAIDQSKALLVRSQRQAWSL